MTFAMKKNDAYRVDEGLTPAIVAKFQKKE